MKVAKILHVFKNKQVIGKLTDEGGKLVFEYTADWIQTSGAQPLTEHIPLVPGKISGGEVTSFFDNLLPEGDVLQKISKWEHISPDNVFGLLGRFGGDTFGAFYILPPGVNPDESRYHHITVEHLNEWITTMKTKPLVLNAKGSRMSLSGAQDKITLMIKDDKLYLPIAAAPSTHILKPKIADKAGVEHSAINEALMMTLGQAIGLNVATVAYRNDLSSVLVTRYDRKMTSQGITRLHQLDFCQLLNIPSIKKYEAEGGPSLKDCFNLLLTSVSNPAKDMKRMIRWLAFNTVIGNMDNHAKNLSILIDNDKNLAPFYDMLCTGIYDTLIQKMAFKIGGENRPAYIMKKHWERLAADLSMRPEFLLSTVLGAISEIENKLPDVHASLSPYSGTQSEKEFLEKVCRYVTNNIKIMRINISEGKPTSIETSAAAEQTKGDTEGSEDTFKFSGPGD